MTLGNAWAFPAAAQDEGLGAMKALADALQPVTTSCDERGHPIDLFRALEPEYLRAAASVSSARGLAVPIPKLCTLVVASAFDAAIHDAYGKAFGVSSYATYGPSFVSHDLSRDLGPEFKGEYLDRYVPVAPRATTPLFHSIGASDPLEAADVRTPINDGLPETFEEWIPRDGLMRFKIKLNGGNLDGDVERIVRIDRIVNRVEAGRGVAHWKYLLDFNEGCPNVGYLLDCLQARARGDADRLRAHPLYRATNGARPPQGPRQRHARGRAPAAGRHRRVAHRPRDAAARARDGVHRGRAQSVQGARLAVRFHQHGRRHVRPAGHADGVQNLRAEGTGADRDRTPRRAADHARRRRPGGGRHRRGLGAARAGAERRTLGHDQGR